MSPTRTLGLKSPTGSRTVTSHYIYDEVVPLNITKDSILEIFERDIVG